MKSKERIAQFSLITSILGIYVVMSYVFYGLLVVVVLFMNKNLFDPSSKLDLCNDAKFPYIYCFLHKISIPLVFIMAGSYALPVFMYGPKRFFYDFLANVVAYLFFSPAYIHTLLIYAFCNGISKFNFF